jgi:8-oxo-dGTP pyrophosphatase MutT (NUDIX family)
MESTTLPAVRQLSAGTIVYNRTKNGIRVLILEQNNEFYRKTGRASRKRIMDIGPCGKIEEGESAINAAIRETKQEVNLDLDIDTSFDEELRYSFNGIALSGKFKGMDARILRTRRYFIAEASDDDLKALKLSEEHSDYMLIPIEDAIRLKFLKKPQRALLKKAREKISLLIK